MTELEIRELIADTAAEYLGCNEAEGTHRPIIDLYNKINPLPRGYKLSYSDPWCAGFVSAIGEECGLGDYIFPECSCDAMIKLYKAKGQWREHGSYSPKVGDLTMYDWEKNGSADHVGIVYSKAGDSLTVIEGNVSDSVDFRYIKANSPLIIGYCCPDYEAAAKGDTVIVPDTVVLEAAAGNASKTAVRLSLRELSRGMVGEDVAAMQVLLEFNGCSCGKCGADGELGADTEAAVYNFQIGRGLEADGVCGVNTWSELLGI